MVKKFSFNGIATSKIQRLVRQAREEQKKEKSMVYNEWIIEVNKKLKEIKLNKNQRATIKWNGFNRKVKIENATL